MNIIIYLGNGLSEASKNNKNEKSEKNVTKMVISICILYLIGNVPNSISPMLFTIGLDTINYNNYVIFGNILLFSSHGAYFFLYYFTNTKFKNVFNRLFWAVKVEDFHSRTSNSHLNT